MNTAHRSFPQISLAMIAAELLREETQRKRFYPGRVETARMTKADMQHELAAIAALRQDVARLEASWFTPNPLKPATHGISWNDRRHAIGRELNFRRHVYPRQVEEAKLTQHDADHRLACLTALAAIFDDGFDWRASNGATPQFHLVETDRAIDQARREWGEHTERVAAQGSTEKQKELQL